MDRLHTVIFAAALALAASAAAGCEKKGGSHEDQPPSAPAGRVDAVKTIARQPVTVEELCDVHKDAASAPALTLPALAAGESAPAAGSWRWINVWAPWCVPCTDEMPKLVTWQKSLAAQGKKVDLVFLSAEPGDDKLAAALKADPRPVSLRMANQDDLSPWLTSLGLNDGAPIPVHVFVDPANKVRCVRSGALKESDVPAIAKVLGT